MAPYAQTHHAVPILWQEYHLSLWDDAGGPVWWGSWGHGRMGTGGYIQEQHTLVLPVKLVWARPTTAVLLLGHYWGL